jgi:NIMA (never in mitosis gene a)-related kinase 1/4/5
MFGKKPLDENAVLLFLIQILLGLQHLHARGIAHRDLKPINIFVTSDTSVKIGDCGLAKVCDYSDQTMMSKCGTPVFMAPEVHRGEPYKLSADMFSLGAVLFRICEGKLPFTNEEDLLNGRYPKPTNKYSPLFTRLIESLLSPNPEERPTCMDILTMPELAPIALEVCLAVRFGDDSDMKARIDARQKAMHNLYEERKEPIPQQLKPVQAGLPKLDAQADKIQKLESQVAELQK